MKKNSVILVLVVSVLCGILIFFMPNIYKYRSSKINKKVEGTIEEETKESIEQITLKSDVVKDLIYPNMHINIYKPDTYYNNSVFMVNDMSNNDILANAFNQLYEGYIVNYNVSGCAQTGKAVSAEYIDFRIKNIISDSINYSHNNFYIFDNQYSGLWGYDSVNNIYVYNGNCENYGNTKYYDLKKVYDVKASNDNSVLEIFAKVGFVKVDNNQYIIYKNPNYTEELTSGNFTSIDDLNEKLEKLNTKKYKYTFKNDICTYESYCMEKGEWINE